MQWVRDCKVNLKRQAGAFGVKPAFLLWDGLHILGSDDAAQARGGGRLRAEDIRIE